MSVVSSSILTVLIVLLLVYMTWMPGASFRGELPALSSEESVLRALEQTTTVQQ